MNLDKAYQKLDEIEGLNAGCAEHTPPSSQALEPPREIISSLPDAPPFNPALLPDQLAAFVMD